MAAVPSIGRAARVEHPASPGVDATSELYERFAAQIFGYCLHQLGSREEAEDAVQTTFMNAFRGLQRGIVPQVESAWLFKIADNVCLSRRRSTWRRGRVEAPNNLEVLQEVVPARDERIADELIRLQDVLEEMPESQRRAILLREWQGLSYREISEELDVSQSAVETLIFRARRALAAGLAEAPVKRRWRGPVHYGFDAGAALAALKALLAGGAATVAVATSTAAVSGGQYYIAQQGRHVSPVPQHAASIMRAPTRTLIKASAPAKHRFVAPKRATAAVRTSRPAVEPFRPATVLSPTPAPAPEAGLASPPAPEAQPERRLDSTDPPAALAPAPPAQADGDLAAQSLGEHGKATAPGLQGKDKPDRSHGNGRN